MSRANSIITLVSPFLLGCALCGCAADRTGVDSVETSSGQPLDVHCQEVAKHREEEAGFHNEDDWTLKQVYAITYKMCTDWRSRHLRNN